MDYLKCNRLQCRQALTDRAVVTTCSHCFCVDCANELFGAAQICPACETSLTEPDDVVICSLHPTSDYKTSVLAGLNPSIILEICGRAISFWQYQAHQENSFQQAVLKTVNERAAHSQKQLDNVVREANGQLSELRNNITVLERELELERRKNRELQDFSRDKDKEYQKLKNQYDKLKRKMLLTPGSLGAVQENPAIFGLGSQSEHMITDDSTVGNKAMGSSFGGFGSNVGLSMGQVVGGMEANKIQRTPVRTVGHEFGTNNAQGPVWQQPQYQHAQAKPTTQRFIPRGTDPHAAAGGERSENSDSASEVDKMLRMGQRQHSSRQPGRNVFATMSGTPNYGAASFGMNKTFSSLQNPLTNKRQSGTFRPAR